MKLRNFLYINSKGSVKIISQISMQTLAGMKSAGNRGVLQSSLQVPNIHVLLVAPLSAGDMAQPGTDQHEGGVAIRERAHHPSTAADFPVKPFYDIIGTDARPVFTGKIAVGKRLINTITSNYK